MEHFQTHSTKLEYPDTVTRPRHKKKKKKKKQKERKKRKLQANIADEHACQISQQSVSNSNMNSRAH